MTETGQWRLIVDNNEYTGEFQGLDVSLPAVVHDIPHDDGRAQRRVLGPAGASFTITEPSDRLAALADGGRRVYQVKAAYDCGESYETLSALMQFHEVWTDRDGTRKAFASRYVGPHDRTLWITEPKVKAGGDADAAPSRRGGK